jgi:ribosomal protein S12 methylthiotransferase
MRGRPRASTVARRVHELTDLQMHVAAARNASRVGSRTTVLVDALCDPGAEPDELGSRLARGAVAFGRSQAEALDIDGTIHLHAHGELRPGEFVEARIDDADAYDLRGHVVAAGASRLPA